MAEMVFPIFGFVLAAGLFFILAAVGLSFFHQSRKNRGASVTRFDILENLEDGINLLDVKGRSKRKEIESTLQLQSFALNAAANAIVITNVGGSIEWVNPAFTRLTGYTPEEVLGANPRILKSSRTTSEQYADLWRTILDGKVWHGELVNRRKDESEYIEEMTISPMLGDDGHISHFIAIKQDITQRRQAEEALIKAHQRLKIQFAEINALKEKLREQAIRDPLTGLFNRRYLQETLKRELSRARRDQVPVSIVMMDIDYFKQVNDSYGHAAGDSMLQDLGEMLRALTREGDVACRFGGEEFIAVMPGAPLSVGVERAELIRREFEFLKVKVADFKLHPTLSLGVAAFPEHASTVDELLAAADRALYLSKQNGRNQVQIYKD
jgi:diguanylate cyclase (GGDEF)-like protein/PAS domain S-box-containing protein